MSLYAALGYANGHTLLFCEVFGSGPAIRVKESVEGPDSAG